MYFTRVVFFLAILTLGIRSSHADLTMVQEIENFDENDSSRKEQIVTQISGKRLRLDLGQMMSSIILSEKKITYSIMHESRQYVVLSHDQPGGKGAMIPGGTSSKTAEGPAPEKTGKTEKISGYTCRQVLLRDPSGPVMEIWLSEDAMEMSAFLKEFQGFGEFSMAQMLGELEKHPELRGVPIRVIQYDSSKMRMRYTVKRLDAGNVPDSAFEVPAGYAEIKPGDFQNPESDPASQEQNLPPSKR